jgi:hypothetical protein
MPSILRLQVVYQRTRVTGAAQDVAVTTHDFVIDDASWPAAAPHNYETLESDWATFYNALVGAAPSVIGANTKPIEYRWYREDDGELPWGDPARVTTLTGFTGAGNQCPPQVACTVTEIVSSRRHWGRFYLPGISAARLSADGSLTNATVTLIANAAETLYEAWSTRGVRPVVLGKTPVGSGSILGEEISDALFAYEVTEIRVDDILDVQRSRRYEQPNLRETRVIT